MATGPKSNRAQCTFLSCSVSLVSTDIFRQGRVPYFCLKVASVDFKFWVLMNILVCMKSFNCPCYDIDYQASDNCTHWVQRPKHGMHSQRLELEWLSFLPPSFLPSLLPCYILSYLGENLLFSVCLSVRQSHRKSG